MPKLPIKLTTEHIFFDVFLPITARWLPVHFRAVTVHGIREGSEAAL